MSIEDRDWIREEEPRGFSFKGLPPILTIISVTTFAFLVQSAVSNGNTAGEVFIEEHLALTRRGVLGGEVWQPITYLLLHAGLGHVFWNMFGVWAFGTILRGHASDRTVWFTYLAGGLAGAAACVLWEVLLPGATPSMVIGASGALMALLVAAACRAPRTPLRLPLLPLPIPLWLVAVLYVALDLIGAVELWAGGRNGSVAVQAHLGGAACGAVLFLIARGRGRARSAPPSRIRREMVGDDERLAPVPAAPAPDAEERRVKARVDTLLAKIHAWGMDSLSDEEKEFLKRASERYRK